MSRISGCGLGVLQHRPWRAFALTLRRRWHQPPIVCLLVFQRPVGAFKFSLAATGTLTATRMLAATRLHVTDALMAVVLGFARLA
jgi:hypothetical protein